MSVELMLVLLFVGAGCGAVSALIAVSPMLIAFPALYFFLPVFGVSLEDALLPIIATCLVAFIPVHMSVWIKAMKQGKVDFQQLVYFSPGIAMGGVIGAQLLSIINVITFQVMFSAVAVWTMVHLALRLRASSQAKVSVNTNLHLPLGLTVGVLSVIAGNCGRSLGESLIAINGSSDKDKRKGTLDGFVVFTSIAAMVGFIFPAQSFDHLALSGYAGAVHLPSLLILMLVYSVCFWLCHRKGNELDRIILSIGLIIFIACTLLRLWF